MCLEECLEIHMAFQVAGIIHQSGLVGQGARDSRMRIGKIFPRPKTRYIDVTVI
jgi:hypothetical protein